MSGFLDCLKEQRWDDHRYYHHSRINQSLHLVSALTFVFCYCIAFKNPSAAALLAWLVAMTSRQCGHFFFEPKGYDHVNDATHAHKEDIKVGYNLRRKVVLMTVWALSPLIFVFSPTMFHTIAPHSSPSEFLYHVGNLWLAIGVFGLLFRTLQLFIIRDLQTGLVWATKIITDPFHDIKLYYRAPMALMRGELIAEAPAH